MIDWQSDSHPSLKVFFSISCGERGRGVHSDLYWTFIVYQKWGFFLETRVDKLTVTKYISFENLVLSSRFSFLVGRTFVNHFDNIIRSVATRYRTHYFSIGCRSMVANAVFLMWMIGSKSRITKSCKVHLLIVRIWMNDFVS